MAAGTSTGVELIAAERARQVEAEGYTAEHDRERAQELIDASGCYVDAASVVYSERERPLGVLESVLGAYPPPPDWPWERAFWKPTADTKRNLVKAGALIAAALDALNAAEAEREGAAS